jgi:hypothetical protein
MTTSIFRFAPFLIAIASACATPRTATPIESATGSPTLATRRAQMIDWLAEYQQLGEFPTDDLGLPTSVFRDRHGVRCPMAELIHRSGHDELVDAVARTNNTLRLADVHDGPLLAWMETSGLTRDEIIMIQGALTPGEMRRLEGYGTDELRVAGAFGEVHGKLETAIVALRDGTVAALRALANRPAPTATAQRQSSVVLYAKPTSRPTTDSIR